MNNQYNFDNLFNHGEGNKAMGGVIAIKVNGEQICAAYINTFSPHFMTKEMARNEAMGFIKPGSVTTSSSDEEVAECLINCLAYWHTFEWEVVEEERNKDPESTMINLKICAALISTLTDTDFWGVTADLESDGFMSQYTFKSLTKDKYAFCVKQIHRLPA